MKSGSPGKSAITGLVLAGGQGSRMGGLDKGLVEFAGREMVAWVLEALRPQVCDVLISANRNLDRYRRTGARVVTDAEKGFAGPLAGLSAGLHASATPYLAVVPCDGPFVPEDLVGRLAQAFGAGELEIAAAHDGDRLHPTFALLDKKVLPDMEAYLAGGGRKVQEFYFTRQFASVDFSDCPDAFLNLNTPEDMERASFKTMLVHKTQGDSHES